MIKRKLIRGTDHSLEELRKLEKDISSQTMRGFKCLREKAIQIDHEHLVQQSLKEQVKIDKIFDFGEKQAQNYVLFSELEQLFHQKYNLYLQELESKKRELYDNRISMADKINVIGQIRDEIHQKEWEILNHFDEEKKESQIKRLVLQK